MIPLLLLAAAGLLADGNTRRSHAPAHRARANLADFISDSDYPADAIRRGEQGIVGFSVEVDAAGRVAACGITHSSGTASLDAATCRIMRERARFEPARDRRGRPVPDRASARIRWVLPDPDPSRNPRANLASYISDNDYPAEAIRAGEQGTVGFALDIGPDGLVSACRVTASSNSASLDETTCRILTSQARFAPARDSAGNAVADRMEGRIRWVLPADEPEPANEVDLSAYISSADYPAEAIRQRIEGRVGIALSVSPQGRAARCEVTQPGGSALLDARTCDLVLARARFVPATDEAGRAVASVVLGYVQWALPAP